MVLFLVSMSSLENNLPVLLFGAAAVCTLVIVYLKKDEKTKVVSKEGGSKSYVIHDTSRFDEELKKLQEEHKDATLFLYFVAGEDPETGKSWCPDCADAAPVVKEAAEKATNVIFVECPVGEPAGYRNRPEHVYRKHEQIQLQRIPTLVKWTKEGPVARLVEGECGNPVRVAKFFAE